MSGQLLAAAVVRILICSATCSGLAGGLPTSQSSALNSMLVSLSIVSWRHASHIYSGADYILAECDPGDLDPHAVSSILKTFLRERKSVLCVMVTSPLTFVFSTGARHDICLAAVLRTSLGR